MGRGIIGDVPLAWFLLHSPYQRIVGSAMARAPGNAAFGFPSRERLGRYSAFGSAREFDVKPRPSNRRPNGRPRDRKVPARDTMPPDVPEVTSAALPMGQEQSDPIPEHIRRMLEAAYT